MITRRDFVIKGSALAFSGIITSKLFASDVRRRLTILHTNDIHSHIDPFVGGKYDGLGGLSRLSTLVNQIRSKEKKTLLLDAGDVLQGTPYFNFYHGEAEYKIMTAMKYDAGCIGNHDFDAGIPGMIRNYKKHCFFDIVNSNYSIEDNYLRNRIKKYIIKNINGIKIGIFGLGVKLKSLVGDSACQGFTYHSPIDEAKKMVKILRKKENADLVICLSHLGYTGWDKEAGDTEVADKVSGIDIIIGGHSHTFMEKPDIVGTIRPTYIFQVGFGGINLGRFDIEFDKDKRITSIAAAKYSV